MRLGITGATGFIGGHLARAAVARGDRVRCLVRRGRRVTGLEAEYVEGDLADGTGLEGFCEGLDAIVHLAGVTRAASPLEFFRLNAGSTRRLLRAARGAAPDLSRFVAVSSQAVLGPSAGRADFLDEEGPARPLTPYGAAKAAMEATVGREAGELPWTILRPASVYGPGDRDFLAVFRAASLGLSIGFGADSLVSLVYVDNLVDAILLALEAPGAIRETFILADEPPLSHAGMGRLAGAALGIEPLHLRAPVLAARLAALAGSPVGAALGRPPLLNTWKVREIAHPWWLVSAAKARRVLGWRQGIPNEEGFARTMAWYAAEGLLPRFRPGRRRA